MKNKKDKEHDTNLLRCIKIEIETLKEFLVKRQAIDYTLAGVMSRLNDLLDKLENDRISHQ